jgi:hypothetical protein
MENLVIIIPIHEYNDDIKPLLERAIKSIPKGLEVRLSCANGISEQLGELKDIKDVKLTIYEDKHKNAKSDFATLVNQAVGESKWFSILEFDDEYTQIWYDNAIKHLEYNPDISVLMTLTDIIDFNTQKYVGFGNEAPWASSFSNEIGYIDYDCLQSYFDFSLTGSIFNTDDWKEVGGLKPSIKLSFWYELMLRWTNKGKKFYVMPKIGYKHYINRPSSLYETYKNEIDKKEGDWWYELAKQECYYSKDRNKIYSNDEKGE